MRTSQNKNTAGRAANGLNHEVELICKTVEHLLVAFAFPTVDLLFYQSFCPLLLRALGSSFFILLTIPFAAHDAFSFPEAHLTVFQSIASILMADTFMFFTLWLMSDGFQTFCPPC